MKPTGIKRVAVGLSIAAVVLGVAVAAGAATVSVRTNGGDVIQGTLSGLAQMLRLADPAPAVGPAAQFDIPLDSIQQIWVDFPRVVIETADRVLIGPFSAFAGIAQLLRIDQVGSFTEIPFAAIRQIAFGDAGFEELPRDWLGQGWLNQRVYMVGKAVAPSGVSVSAPTTVEPEFAAVETATDTDEVVWNGAAAPATTPSTSGELPWWVLLIGAAAVFALFLFLPRGGGS
jgi:hypothetical protein